MAKYPKPRKWTPTHPEKYEGDVTNIIARSSWEIRFMNWADSNSGVISWGSETIIIPYRSPIDQKPHRYYCDFRIKIKTSTGLVKTYLIEIKPHCQTFMDSTAIKNKKRYLAEATTFMVNQAKWAAADRWAKDRGWEFKVLTEYDLGIAQKVPRKLNK
jgi:hypothetical protein